MTDSRAVMAELPEFGETVSFDPDPPSKPFVFGGVSGDEYGLSDILLPFVYRAITMDVGLRLLNQQAAKSRTIRSCHCKIDFHNDNPLR